MAWLAGVSGGVYARLTAAYCCLLRPFGFLRAKPLRQGPGGAKGSPAQVDGLLQLVAAYAQQGRLRRTGGGGWRAGKYPAPLPRAFCDLRHTHTHGLGCGRRPAGSPACCGLLRLAGA